jgi:hypothetical protein
MTARRKLLAMLDWLRGEGGQLSGDDAAPCVSWPERMNAALKPGHQTWLVARAVSLKAF